MSDRVTGILVIDSIMNALVSTALAKTEWAEGTRPGVSAARQRLRETVPDAEECVRLMAQIKFARRLANPQDAVWPLTQEAFDVCFNDIWNDMKTWPGRTGPAGDVSGPVEVTLPTSLIMSLNGR